ncbi:hypothetical protein [Clostridium uliginosum]|uniref:Uncharacterized protein n=1 Tax=Clostridium uliginosum TaxID=119641 RepID=A0A1I1NZ73_9CLOT|nr:hypothetical protein [Clostridium uliginosum]SFD02981.1 hypothetical protein SAMN05421842_11772 [Clostridium uliginosum]
MRVKKCSILYAVVLIISLSTSVLVAIKTKSSYIDDINFNQLRANASLLNFIVSPSLKKDDISGSIKNLPELEDLSNVIAKIKVSNEREYKSKTLLTKCKIDELYKNDGTLSKDEYIYIYEPASYTFVYNSFKATNGYNYMKSDNEYIVFLNSLNAPKNYKKSEVESLTYTFVDSVSSKFSCNSTPSVISIDKSELDNGKKYSEVIQYEYIFNSKELEDKYLNINNDVFNKYIKK